MSETIFTKIINREIPGHFVYEDDTCVAILDKFPAVAGQTLVIPKQQIDYAFALDVATYQHLSTIAQRVARALDTVFQTERTCMVVEGFEVPHAHIKLYPVLDTTPLGKVLPHTTEADDGTLAAQAEKIIAALTIE